MIILVTRGTRVSASTRLPLMRKLSLGQGLPPPDAQVSLAAAAVARSEHKELPPHLIVLPILTRSASARSVSSSSSARLSWGGAAGPGQADIR